MSKENVKIGVVGVGHLGRWHVQQLKTISDARVVGIFDVDPQRATEISGEFDVKPYFDFPELLSQTDALSIVTPTTTHFDYAKQALQNGKHVFIEKPVTETVEQGEEISNIAREKNLKLQVGHIERFNPAILALEPTIKNPLFIESHRLSTFNPRGTDVAVVLDLMIHDIDLVLSFIKSPVKSIHASGVSIISPTLDIANCRLEFTRGEVANVTASRISTRKMRKMRFFQPNAYVSVDFLEGAGEVYHLSDPNSPVTDKNLAFSLGSVGGSGNPKEIRYTRYEKKDINPLNYELALFIKSIQNDTPTAVSGEDAVRALNVAEKILQDIEEHAKTVKTHWKI